MINRTRWVDFAQCPDRCQRKDRGRMMDTLMWDVTTKGDFNLIGWVVWDETCDQYCFEPMLGAILTGPRLSEIAHFCNDRTTNHITAARIERAQRANT